MNMRVVARSIYLLAFCMLSVSGNSFVLGQGAGMGGGGGLGGGVGGGAVGSTPLRNSVPGYGGNRTAGSGGGNANDNCHLDSGDYGFDGSDYNLCPGQGECSTSEPVGSTFNFFGSQPAKGFGSCSTCGGTGGTHNLMAGLGSVRAGDFARVWLPNNRVNNSSFSPGYYSHYDSQLNVFIEEDGNAISFFDVYAGRVFQLFDGLEGDTFDGTYTDTVNKHIKEMKLYTSSNATTTDPTQAATAVITHWNGFKESFQLVDLDPSSTQVQLVGRLAKRIDLDGRELVVTYKSWTAGEIATAPDRQWQIDTVTDSFGSTLTFTYGATQQSGRWSVSRIDRNDGQFITHQYTNGMLTSVTHPGGEQSTFAYGQDSVAQTATVTIRDINGQNRDLKYHLTNDYMSLSTSGQSEVINQPTGVRRMIEESSGDVEWLYLPQGSQSFVYRGGNQAYLKNNNLSSYRYDNWQISSGGPVGGYMVDGGLNPQMIGVASGTTTSQLYRGEFPGLTNFEGITTTFQRDASLNVTKKTYTGDSSYKDFSYNTFKQITRERDRTGDVTQYVYDSQGHLLIKKTGLIEQGGTDVATAQYAEYQYEYYPSTHTNKGLLKSEMSPLYQSSSPTLHRTDYEYNTKGMLTKITGPAAVNGGDRPVTLHEYDSSNRLIQSTDPEGHITSYAYNSSNRQISITYPDGTTEQTLYGAAGTADAGRVLKTKNRMGVVSSREYDSAGRLVKVISPSSYDANILDGLADDTPISDPNIRTVNEFVYLEGSADIKSKSTVNGVATDYAYDYHNRVTEVKQYPRVGVTLTSKKNYLDNKLFSDEDPYGRRKYYGYRASDGTLIRTITSTVPEYTLTSFASVWNLVRDASANAKYIIHDAIRDNDGLLVQILDGRGIETRMEYDSLGRETNKRVAYGTSIEARTETVYDLAGNVTEVRTPRYFDSTDTNGYQKAREQWTYNGRGKVLTHVVSPGTAEGATESFTYDLNGHQATRTDFGNNVWTRIEDSCCDKQTASVDPLGHGTITNTDSLGRATHTAQVSEVSTHVGNFANPIDAKTLSESTTKYDAAGRPVYQTTWLTPRGAVDPANPPIAGVNGVPATDGLTTQYFYDNNLSDGVGLDNATGVSVLKLGTGGSGTFNVTLANAISKLAGTQANGGAGITFNSTAPGRATITVNAEDEISFSISDAAGRSVMSGKLNNYRGSGASAVNTVATWSCSLHDATTNLAGYGTLLVTQSIDALGNATKTWTDAAGRTLRSLDQLDKVTTVTYDAGGNQLTVRDPNNVGADMVYDALGRNTQRTDTFGDITKTDYDRSGNAVKQTDAKNKFTLIAFDSRNRRKSTSDRISASTNFAYTALGQLASLTDAENQTTAYTYDARGSKLTEQYPDHTSGSTVGQPGYGIVTFVYDKAGRVSRKQDQAGDTCSYNYDLAGRMTSRNYRTAANSPTGTIADTDTFTFDRAGRMLTAVSGRYTNTVAYAYDPVGRKGSESLTIASQTYTVGSEFNARNELTKYTYPDGSIANRAYTARGALSELKLDSSVIDTRTYDDGGRLTSEVLGNGITETRAYRTDNLLSSINYSNTNVGNLAYSWDANKNKTAETIAGVMSGYGFTAAGTTYDFEDRLTGYQRASGSFNQSWSLTTVGDWTSVTTNGTAQTRTHGPTHELLTAGGQTVTTDVKGNQTALPALLSTSGVQLGLNWDFDNKLKSADSDNNGSADVTFEYDALGRRVARTQGSSAVVYFQADQQTIADYPRGGAASAATYRYVYGSYIDEPVVRKTTGTGGTVLYYHRNQQYSVTALSDSSGNVSERYAYTAYGQPTFLNATGAVQTSSAASNRYTYTGREWDSTLGLHHFRARWMSGFTGRFLTRDPIGFDGSQWDQYEYLGRLLLSANDPSGLAATQRCSVELRCTNLVPGIEHCGLEINGSEFFHVFSPYAGAFGLDTCDLSRNTRIDTPTGVGPWRLVDTWNDPTGNLCDCIRSKAGAITKAKLPYKAIPEWEIDLLSDECNQPAYCNSNYSTSCIMSKCGIVSQRDTGRSAPGWGHRMQYCSKKRYVGSRHGCTSCRCDKWENKDGDWCADKPAVPTVNPVK